VGNVNYPGAAVHEVWSKVVSDQFTVTYEAKYPKATACLLNGEEIEQQNQVAA
jgi:hypothetical protein